MTAGTQVGHRTLALVALGVLILSLVVGATTRAQPSSLQPACALECPIDGYESNDGFGSATRSLFQKSVGM